MEGDSRKIRMIEAFKGEIRHSFDDGLYIHTGDLMDTLEADRTACEEVTDFKGQEILEDIIARFQIMILNRKGGAP